MLSLSGQSTSASAGVLGTLHAAACPLQLCSLQKPGPVGLNKVAVLSLPSKSDTFQGDLRSRRDKKGTAVRHAYLLSSLGDAQLWLTVCATAGTTLAKRLGAN